MTVGSKIKALREAKGLTQIDLVKKSGISRATIQSYEKNDASITISVIEKISKALDVDVSYFLSPSQSPSVSKLSPSHQVVDEVQQRSTITVNYYPNILASAGFGALNHDTSTKTLELEEGFLMALGLKCFKNLDLITVYGDSMEPFISNGELIILQRDVEARNSDIVVANIGGDIYVKKLQRDPLKKWLKLTSLNAMYPDIELKEDEIKHLTIIGIVRAKIRPF